MHKKLILSVFAFAAVFAQPPGMGMGPRPGAGPAFTEIKAYLNLTDTQLDSIRNANRAAMEANRAAMDQIRQKRQALQTALAGGSTDAAAIGRAMLEIQALHKQVETNQTKAREQALSFLDAGQKTKLKALEDAEKLREEIGEAHALQLLAPPANAQQGPGHGPGPGHGHGPGGMGGPRGPGGPGMNRFQHRQQ